jgi:UrcA family protein
MKTSFLRRWAYAVAAAALVGPGHGAPAAEPAATAVVPYGDLDLSSDAGAQQLLRRIRSASRRVCRDLLTGERIDARARYEACVTETYELAAAQAERERRASRQRGRTAAPPAVRVARL